ncbi:MAG: large conductance mechanosensitive channel protein MscL [Acidimicrobiia bacterium]|nr:large conductance mechanosensitive channel protein MscL [Acidimicrobiia bacterium]
MLKEFRDFINRGNVVDLAVAVVVGAAFGAVVTSFTNDILMQVIAVFGGTPDFSDLVLTVGDTPIRYGAFLTALISFLIIAFAVFLVVKALNAAQARIAREDEEADVEQTEVELLAEIRDLLGGRSGS